MIPSATIHNAADSSKRHTIFIGQFPIGGLAYCVPLPDALHVWFRQLGSRVKFAYDRFGMIASIVPFAGCHAPFSGSIGKVISCRAEEQMIGIDASGIVASVANEHTCRNRPVVQGVGEPVRLLMAGDATASISLPVNAACPKPAGICLVDPLPKASRRDSESLVTLLAMKIGAVPNHQRSMTAKHMAAFGTCKRDRGPWFGADPPFTHWMATTAHNQLPCGFV